MNFQRILEAKPRNICGELLWPDNVIPEECPKELVDLGNKLKIKLDAPTITIDDSRKAQYTKEHGWSYSASSKKIGSGEDYTQITVTLGLANERFFLVFESIAVQKADRRKGIAAAMVDAVLSELDPSVIKEIKVHAVGEGWDFWPKMEEAYPEFNWKIRM